MTRAPEMTPAPHTAIAGRLSTLDRWLPLWIFLVMDKTGTVTFGAPRVTEVINLNGLSESELLTRAAAIERYSEHPVASAVLAEAQGRDLALAAADAFENLPGEGVVGGVDGVEVACGNARLMARRAHSGGRERLG